VNERDTLTIRQVATLLNCHPNTVRNRIKSGAYRAEKVITERGETYMIPRSELSDSTTNRLPSASQSQSLPDVREAMRAMLEPFVKELGDVREELGRERARREHLQHERDELRQDLDALRERLEAARTVEEAPEGSEPRPATPGPQTAAQGAERRSWWRRLIGG
jgi:excisionase family DNA binding protein